MQLRFGFVLSSSALGMHMMIRKCGPRDPAEITVSQQAQGVSTSQPDGGGVQMR